MNTIEITNMSLTSNDPKETSISGVFKFCKELNEFLTKIKTCHLFTNNYPSHTIYGDLYSTLSDLFDSLEEEIISLVKSGCDEVFPTIETVFEYPSCEESDYYRFFKSTIVDMITLLTCNSFEIFLENAPKHGIKNILEEIYSASNKAEYLLKMAIKTEPEQVSNNSDSGIQIYTPTDSPSRTFEIRPTL